MADEEAVRFSSPPRQEKGRPFKKKNAAGSETLLSVTNDDDETLRWAVCRAGKVNEKPPRCVVSMDQ